MYKNFKTLYNTLKNIERNKENIPEDSRSSDWIFLSNFDNFMNVLIIGSMFGKNFENLFLFNSKIDLIRFKNNKYNLKDEFEKKEFKIIDSKNLDSINYKKYDLVYIDDFSKFIIQFNKNKNLLKTILNSRELIIKNKFSFKNLDLIFKKIMFKKNFNYKTCNSYNFFPKEPIPFFISDKSSNKANKILLERILYLVNNISFEIKQRNRLYFFLAKIILVLNKFLPLFTLLRYFYFNNYYVFKK